MKNEAGADSEAMQVNSHVSRGDYKAFFLKLNYWPRIETSASEVISTPFMQGRSGESNGQIHSSSPAYPDQVVISVTAI